MKHSGLAIFGAACLATTSLLSAQETRTITLTVDEVTQPSLAVSADGKTLYFAILGDLVALPTSGGEARQLTSGPAYDSWPSPSRDGETLYFLSDQAIGQTELHRLDLQSGRIERLTELGLGLDELSVDDANNRFAAVAVGAGRRPIFRTLPDGIESVLDRVPPRLSRPSYLADGRAVALERNSRSGSFQATDGGPPEIIYQPTGARLLEWGAIDPTGSYAAVMESGDWTRAEPDYEEILVVALQTNEVLLRKRIGLARGEPSRAFHPAFTGDVVFLPLDGGIAVFDLQARTLEPLTWQAELEVQLPVRNDRALSDPGIADTPVALETIGDVRPSPDGQTVVFAAAGDLFVQRYGSPARQFTAGPAFDSIPWFDADGQEIWFARDGSLHTIRLSGGAAEDRGIHVGAEFADYFALDGGAEHLTTFGSFRAPGVQELDLDDGEVTSRVPGGSAWVTIPSYGADGEIVFTADLPGSDVPQIYSLPKGTGQPIQLSDFQIPPHRAVASGDGRFIAFLRDGRAWYAPRTEEMLVEEDCTSVGPMGAHSLFFNRDGTLWITAGSSVVPFDCQSQQLGQPWDLSVEATPEPAPAPVLITDVNYVDVVSGEVVPGVSIEIRDRRIAGIYSSNETPSIPGAEIIAGDGRYVIPGLADMHVHHLGEGMPAILAYGVTMVRQLGAQWPVQRRDAEMVRLGRTPGPDFLSAAEIFEGARPNWGNAFHIVEEAPEAVALLDQRVELGMDVVKLYSTLPRGSSQPLLARAIELGVPSTMHVVSLRRVLIAISDGVGGFEHFPESAPELRGDVLALMAAANVAWCPTLSVRGAGDFKRRLEPEELRKPKFQRAIPPEHLSRWSARGKVEPMSDANLAAFLQERGEILARAAEMGVTLISGSDCSTGNALIGPSIHWEMEFLVRGGMAPIDALRTATLSPAKHYGLTDRGVIRKGAWADLVILRDNPLEDITNTQSIEMVVRAGSVYTPEQLLGNR